MSHEIRTPLNGIVGYADLLKKASNLSPENMEYVNVIKDCSDGLLVLINDILDFSKIESGKLDLEKIPVNVPDLIESIAKLFSQKAASKGVQVSTYIDNRVPDIVVTDPNRVRQILINLVSNSFKFTEAGKIEINTKIEKISNDDCAICFSVKDTGIGIAKDKLSAVFEKFNQADTSTTRKYGGTGLGLAISKNLSKILGGRMWAESEEGVGSCFSFTIKAQISNQPSISLENSSFRALEESNGEELKILVAEDNHINQKLLSRYLENLSLTFNVVDDGAKVLKELEKVKYDIILMDINMPILDGVETTKEILKTYSSANRPYIIAVTANSMPDDRNRYLSLGMDDYISKPIKQADLEELINAYLLKSKKVIA